MKNQKGFTLIELMVVVVIVGILSAIAIPQYSDYIRRSRVPDAVSGLSTRQTQMEQFFQDNRTYVGGCAGLTGTQGKFAFTCDPAPTANAFSFTATGVDQMAGFVYTIDQAGTKTSTITAGSLAAEAGWTGSASCWVTARGGQC